MNFVFFLFSYFYFSFLFFTQSLHFLHFIFLRFSFILKNFFPFYDFLHFHIFTFFTFVTFYFLHFSLFSNFFILYTFTIFHVFPLVGCQALSSRSFGFGLHSPNLLISHLAGLKGFYLYENLHCLLETVKYGLSGMKKVLMQAVLQETTGERSPWLIACDGHMEPRRFGGGDGTMKQWRFSRCLRKVSPRTEPKARAVWWRRSSTAVRAPSPIRPMWVVSRLCKTSTPSRTGQ